MVILKNGFNTYRARRSNKEIRLLQCICVHRQQQQLQGGPYITANLYSIGLSEHEHGLKQMQYIFAVIYETLSTP